MSHKRRKLQYENDLSSGVISIDGDISTLITFSSNLINVNLGGVAVIVDRTSKFNAQPKYVSWSPLLGISSPSSNGSFIIYVDQDGVPKIGNVNNIAKLPAFDAGGLDMNSAVQLGTYSITNGTITSGTGFIQWTGNLANRFMGLSDALGVINYFGERIRVNIVAATLNLAITTGKAYTRSVGVLNNDITKRPDIVIVPNISPAVIAYALRNNVIVSFGITVNTTQYESPVGTLTAIPPNKAVNNFVVVFPNNQFIGIQFGQMTYNTTLLAQESFEEANFSAIAGNGVPTIQLSFNVGETNLSNALTKALPRFI